MAKRFALPAGSGHRLDRLHHLLATDPLAPTAVREPEAIWNDHLADSLVALELEPLLAADAIVDVGSGAGLPGLPLAIALPEARFTLVESSTRKCAFIARAAEVCGLQNVEIVDARIEDWPAGRRAFEVVLARAVAPLEVVLEYAAPLLCLGGHLIAWRGQRDAEAEDRATRVGDLLGLRPGGIRKVQPYASARARHLHLFLKVMETPSRFPRRTGVAAKRPLGEE